MGKKWMILFSVFSILTFICSISTSALIFYSEKIHTEINSESVLAENKEYKSSSIIYEESNLINLTNLNPGDYRTYKFSVTNNNSNTIKYSIKWQDIKSSWDETTSTITVTHPEEFVYSLKCNNEDKVINETMPRTKEDKYIVESTELKTNQTDECTLSINFLRKDTDQSYNLYKTFKGTYKVIIKE